MYRSLERIEPADLEAIAAWLYVEMLEAGYTSVGEFHYLHHDQKGAPYANPAELSLRVLAAAKAVGIGVTMLPVLYQNSGFDGHAATPGQRRFVCKVDALLDVADRIASEAVADPNVGVGVAPHSLRAVGMDALAELLRGTGPESPVHIHISEQQNEVQDCVAATGQSPIMRLLSCVDVDARFCLVHATHATEAELAGLSQAGATVALCPTTEANLGDGFPPIAGLLEKRVGFGIGSDSQVCVCPAEELRTLEYGQRLLLRRRNVLASDDHPSVAARLLTEVGRSAARVLGRRVGELRVGARADLVVLDPDAPALAGLSFAEQLDAWVFGARKGCVRAVMVGGKWRVTQGKHPDREAVFAGYVRSLRRVL
jgi:formimidoylglutamate deiminase